MYVAKKSTYLDLRFRVRKLGKFSDPVVIFHLPFYLEKTWKMRIKTTFGDDRRAPGDEKLNTRFPFRI